MNLPAEVITAVKGDNMNDSSLVEKKLEDYIPPAIESEKENAKNNNSTECESLIILEEIIKLYKNLDDKIINYKKDIKEKRIQAAALREKKEHLQLFVAINDLPKDDKGNISYNKRDRVSNEIDNNNTHTKEETCNFVINQVEKIRENIPSDISKSWEHIEPLEVSVKLLKTQIKYTKKLEDILDLFSKIKESEEKIKEADEIIYILSEQLK